MGFQIRLTSTDRHTTKEKDCYETPTCDRSSNTLTSFIKPLYAIVEEGRGYTTCDILILARGAENYFRSASLAKDVTMSMGRNNVSFSNFLYNSP